MMRRLLAIIAMSLLSVSVVACSAERNLQRNSEETTLTIQTGQMAFAFEVEIAKTEEEKRTGLMYRSALAENAGMLFDFGPEPRHVSMWMKNTLIPLDMAFLDQQGRIVKVHARTTPQSLDALPSGAPVVAVLEVNGGTFERLGIGEGNRVIHPWFVSP